jgi:PleD family two-component response regulator
VTPIVVLLVEDSAAIRALVRRMLVAGGHSVVEAAGGAAALAACREQHPDVVLLDVEMPEMSGWEVLAAMKADADLRDVPVVFLTGRSDTTDIVDGLRLGAHDYLRKPCQPTELLARVQAAARVKRLQDELRQRNEELDRLSRTDALTGLRNRRHVEEYLVKLTSLARRNVEPIAVLVIDIDHFKSVNDEYGHDAGDAVLRQVAGRMLGRVPPQTRRGFDHAPGDPRPDTRPTVRGVCRGHICPHGSVSKMDALADVGGGCGSLG